MEQPDVGDNLGLMDNLDFTLASYSIQPSSPTEDISAPVRYDYNTSESFYEIDVADLNMTLYPDQFFKDLLNDFRAIEQFSAPSPIMDDINDLLIESTEELHSTETNDIAGPIQSTDEQLAMIKSSNPALPVIRSRIEKLPTKNLNDQSIFLSKSVAVTVPTPKQLQLVHALEDTYRARYKSDYFPQKGAVRRPRYIADNCGNHHITLQMPTAYNRDFKYEYIRVALITTPINNGEYFYSPYKFQTNHNDVKVPDQNPIYIPVQAHPGNDWTMKLHLVLIKSKLDQLNDAQPLKSFSDTMGHIQNLINTEKLSPKDLINKYQLDKSHIAFTLCTKLSNGTYDIHPETTIISSVITESPTKHPAISNNKSHASTVNTGKKISCPNCAHCFDIADGNITKKGNKRKSNDSTSRTSVKSSTNGRTNKKKKTVE
jgi:hypothetical protein